MRKPDWQQNIAEERIIILFNLAKKEFDKHPDRSKRYVQLARKIGLRYNVRFDKELKRKFCKNCDSLLIPGKTEKVRIDSKNKTISRICLKCNSVYRYPYKE
jgi:ribonuclease P protein subunit RPR2